MEYFKRLNHGRLNRRNFFGAWITATLLYFLSLAIVIIFNLKVLIQVIPVSYFEVISFLPIAIIIILLFITNFSLCSRRFHDLGKSDVFALLCFVPYLNLPVWIYLFFARGEAITNSFGDSQSKNLNPIDAILNRTN